MAENTVRRLAAIVAADVAGYSRLVGADEEATLAALRAHRRELIDGLVDTHGGRIANTAGDSLLLEFPSAVDAVKCVTAAQNAMAERNRAVDADRRIEFRVGIHVGDVVAEGGDLLGDGVNIAARIEALATPGGIAISDDAHRQIRDRLDLAWADGGMHKVKNIARPVHIWRWEPEMLAVEPAVADAPTTATPSIAVLPFANMSADPEQEFFCDGIAEDVITALSKISRLKVIARNSSFAYKGTSPDIRRVAEDLGVRHVLEGSVRSGGGRVRVTAQLIDATDGAHLWAERYDRRMDDVFAIQDEIVKEIVANLRVRLSDGDGALLIARGTRNVEAWQNCATAWDLFLKFEVATNLRARALAEGAIALDPDYAVAHALAGWSFWFEARTSLGAAATEKFEQAARYVQRALALDATVPMAIGLEAMVAVAFGRYGDGVDIAERGLAHHPGNADMRAYYALALAQAARYEDAALHFEAAISLNPITPSWYHGGYASALLGLERYEAALAATDRALELEGSHQTVLIYRAYAFESLGRSNDARACVAEVVRLAPLFRLGHLPNLVLHDDPELLVHFTDALGRAGLPA